MPKRLKTPKGELTSPELRKLIRAHNILSRIKVPVGTDRLGLIQLIEASGYKVDHEKKEISYKGKPKQITLNQAEVITRPKKKTEAERTVARVKKQKKKETTETEAFKKRDQQIKALGKVVAKRKARVLKKPIDTVPKFKTIKQLEAYFNKTLNTFVKKEIDPFRKKIPTLSKKEINDQRKALRVLGKDRVLSVINSNEDLFENEDETYEELDARYESTFDSLFTVIQERLKELKDSVGTKILT